MFIFSFVICKFDIPICSFKLQHCMCRAIFNCFDLNRMGNCGWFLWLAAMAGSTTDTRHVTRIQVHTVENAKEQFSASVANLQKRRTNYLDLFRSKTSTKALWLYRKFHTRYNSSAYLYSGSCKECD